MSRRLVWTLALSPVLALAPFGLAAGQPAPPAYAPPPPYQPPANAAPGQPVPLAPPLGSAPAAPAARENDDTAIRNAIAGWADAFNARQSETVCNLFAKDLHYDFGTEPGTYSALCGHLRSALADSAVRYSYSPNIREILISGDLAVVRIVWTLTVTGKGKAAKTVITEPAMFVMRHDPDGSWRVFRFLAFNVPNAPPPPPPH